jgi:hypothetical protein
MGRCVRATFRRPRQCLDGIYWGVDYRDEQRRWNIDIWFVTDARRQPDLQHLRQLAPRLTADTRSAILRRGSFAHRSQLSGFEHAHARFIGVMRSAERQPLAGSPVRQRSYRRFAPRRSIRLQRGTEERSVGRTSGPTTEKGRKNMRKLLIAGAIASAAAGMASAIPNGLASADSPIYEGDIDDCHMTMWAKSDGSGTYVTHECGPYISY